MLYSHRAKLYRKAEQEWKERGLGDVKLLHQEATGRLRLLMRREQVHKICLNHYVAKVRGIYFFIFANFRSWMIQMIAVLNIFI